MVVERNNFCLASQHRRYASCPVLIKQDLKETELTQEEDVDGVTPPQDNNKVRVRGLVKAVNDPDNRVPLPITTPCGLAGEEGGEVAV